MIKKIQDNGFQHVALIARAPSCSIQNISHQVLLLYQALKAIGRSVRFDHQSATEQKVDAEVGAENMDVEALAAWADIGIVFGGDGRLLEIAPCFAKAGKPLLGINYGRLGFLTDIASESPELVLDIIQGCFVPEQRLLLEVKVQRNKRWLAGGVALNDAVLHATISKMIEFELYINDLFVYSQRSDGIIVATPTGSTAYALSAGGPIMQPNLDTLVLVPNSAHTLASRPIVVNADSQIKIRVGHPPYPILSCDGQTKITTEQDDLILINQYPHKLRLVHPANYNFYNTCREKLGWAKKLGKMPD